MTTTPTSTPKRDLTFNKVLAGAGAAATSAVLGSFFGAGGTVVGAAIGSVASTIATAIYQRSLDRTQERLRTRFNRAHADAPTQRIELRPPHPPRRRSWGPWVAATVLIFAVGLGAVTGLELVKGSSLTTGQPGTSVGRVVEPPPDGGSGSPSSDAPTTTSSSRDRDRGRYGDPSSATPTRSPRLTSSSSAVPTTRPGPADEGGALPSASSGG